MCKYGKCNYKSGYFVIYFDNMLRCNAFYSDIVCMAIGAFNEYIVEHFNAIIDRSLCMAGGVAIFNTEAEANKLAEWLNSSLILNRLMEAK